MLYETTDKTFYEDIEDCELVLVDFYSTSCEPCKALSKELEELELTPGRSYYIMKANIDSCVEIATEMKIRAVPTLKLMKNGKVFKTTYGKGMTASQVEEFICGS